MKKAKIISIVVIMLSVIALGVFMGKQMFKLMEAGSTQPSTGAVAVMSEGQASSVKVLYSAKNGEANVEKVIEAKADEASGAVVQATTPAASIADTPAPEITAVAGPSFDPNGPKWFAYASGNGTNVRSGPSTNDKMLFKVSKGTRGVVTEKKDGWTSVKWDFNRKTGWVRDDLLMQGPATVMTNLLQKTDEPGKIDTSKISQAAAKEAIRESLVSVAIAKPALASETVNTYVQGQALPEQAVIDVTTFATIRAEPNTTSEKLGRVPKGMVVKIKSTQKDGRWRWFEVIYNDGRKTGWTREDNLKF
ncbi:MAG: SH3 domain-containing protein [Candidatus Riflebacteria bacterium]|nr:SH3 domain-containing protein [Candidatus Riflebacteria bacterium]